jgi:hypothetical protein
MKELAASLISQAEKMWSDCQGLDTAVRDVAAEGVAYFLWVAYDCEAIAMSLTIEEWKEYSGKMIFKWFHDRGFAVWFALGASSLFRKSRPWACGGLLGIANPDPWKEKDLVAKKES